MTLDRQVFSGLDTILIRVRHIEAAQAWYERMLGMVTTYVDPVRRIVVMDTGKPTSLTLWELKPGEQSATPGMMGTPPIFHADSAPAMRDALMGRGVVVEKLECNGWLQTFGFYDPDGNRLEICEMI